MLGQEQRTNDTILMVTSLYIPMEHLKLHPKRGVGLDHALSLLPKLLIIIIKLTPLD